MNQQKTFPCRHIDCLLLEGFNPLVCASSTEPYNACNHLLDSEHYTLRFIGTEKSMKSETGLTVEVQAYLSQIHADQPDTQIGKASKNSLIICGGAPGHYRYDQSFSDSLLKLTQNYQQIIGVGTGGYALAKSGLLNHRKASVHWWSQTMLHAEMPEILLSNDVFSIDGPYATCRGGTSALDLMFTLIGQDLGTEMVHALSQFFLKERMGVTSPNALPLAAKSPQPDNPKLVEAIALMNANIKEPLSTNEIAHHIQLSRRQLERLFRAHLNNVPSRYYLLLRLDEARKQLSETALSITDIALACGFSSTAHFSTSYRNFFGLTPTEDRAIRK